MSDIGGNIGNIAGNAKNLAGNVWAKNKPLIIGIAVGVVVLFIMICWCCIRCRRKKKKKKEAEKLKLKGPKPSKKLKRIQPNKTERKVMEALGTISFTLQYDKTSGMLMVKVLESEDVPVRDLSGYAYSFVVVKVLPLHEHIETEYKTKLVRAGFWPTFGEVFPFVIDKEELNEQVLYLYQYELNRWSQQDGIGQVAFEVKDADLLKEKVTEVSFKKKLRPYDPLIGLEVESGAVYLALEYDSESWELTIEIRNADVIPMEDDKEKMSTYVTLALLNKEDEVLEKQKSKTKKGTLTPEYDTEVKFLVPDNLLPEIKLLIKLKKKTLLKPPTTIGKSLLQPTSDHLVQLNEKEYTEGWFSVFTKPKNN